MQNIFLHVAAVALRYKQLCYASAWEFSVLPVSTRNIAGVKLNNFSDFWLLLEIERFWGENKAENFYRLCWDENKKEY